jgi:uroporphyrin-III C-methyltransferase
MDHGKVFLVGAGPGDPDLLTVKAARLIGSADVIVHDGLIGEGILDLARSDARLISVAKSRANHSVPQDGINAILVREARAGHCVVRLKGGDPFIFGRGGEEVEACRAAGVPVEVVPGISAAIGGAAAAMLPLTHRDASSAVSFVAGQCKGLSDQNWAGLAGKGRTLVIYMGVATAADITEKLIADGVSPDMPVAVLERVARKDARALRTLLTDLGDMIARERVKSPAIIVVGDVVTRSDAVDVLATLASSPRRRGSMNTAGARLSEIMIMDSRLRGDDGK